MTVPALYKRLVCSRALNYVGIAMLPLILGVDNILRDVRAFYTRYRYRGFLDCVVGVGALLVGTSTLSRRRYNRLKNDRIYGYYYIKR